MLATHPTSERRMGGIASLSMTLSVRACMRACMCKACTGVGDEAVEGFTDGAKWLKDGRCIFRRI